MFTLPAHDVKEIRWKSQQKNMMSLLIISSPQTESEIEEKQPTLIFRLPSVVAIIFLYNCNFELNLWRPYVLSNTPSWNRITGLVFKMKITSYVYYRNKLVSHKKVSKVALQTSFLCIYGFSITESQSLWAFPSFGIWDVRSHAHASTHA